MLLTEGGNAVQTLIDKKLSKHNSVQLTPSSIPSNSLSNFFPREYGKMPTTNDKSIIGQILNALLSKKLIDSKYPPSFTFGSTRLAAISHYGPQKGLAEPDEESSIEAAKSAKSSYGDLDIDVRFTGDKNQIAAVIESIDPSRFACSVDSEIHVAVRYDDTHIAQIDIVDNANPERNKIWQRSSILDTAEGFKGVMLVTLLRSVTREMAVAEEEGQAILSLVQSNPDAPFSQEINKRLANGWEISSRAVGYSLKERGPALLIYLAKGKSSVGIDVGLDPRATYKNLDELAKVLLGDNATQSDMMHFVNLTKYIQTNFDSQKQQAISQNFQQALNKLNLPPELKEKGIKALTVQTLKEAQLLREGGLAGHLSAITDNTELSIKKIKQMLSAIGNGRVSGSEKVDGMANAFFSFKDNQAYFARNKTDAITGGWNLDNVRNREFKGGDSVRAVFANALQSFQSAAQKLDQKAQQRLFENGTIFYNTEIISVDTPNVIRYDANILSLHHTGHIKVNPETHELLPFDEKSVDKLLNVLCDKKESGSFQLYRDKVFKLPPLRDKRDLKIANAKLNKVLTSLGLTDSASLQKILKVAFYKHVKEQLPEFSPSVQKLVVANVYDKVKLALPKGTPPETKARIKALKKAAPAIAKKTLAPIDAAILEFSMEALGNVKSAYIQDNAKEVQRLRGQVGKAIEILQNSGNPEITDFLIQQLSRMKSIDSINTAVEGFVFEFENNLYKLTGSFAPLNQLLGTVKYGRKGFSPLGEPGEAEEPQEGRGPPKVVALLPGGFKPPHAGHYALAKFFADKKEVDKVIIFISPKERSGHSHNSVVHITAEQSLKLWQLYARNDPKIKATISAETSPVQTVFDYITGLSNGDTVLLGQSEKEEAGDKGRFQGNKAEEWAAKHGVRITVKEVNTPVFAGNVSGTQMREVIAAGKKDIFERLIPDHLTPDEKEQAWMIVAPKEDVIQEWMTSRITELLCESMSDPLPSSPFQRDLFKRHAKQKKRLIGVDSPRSKSAPPIGENEENINEISAMGAGSITGSPGLVSDEEDKIMRERKDFIEELKLREHIRGLINSAYSNILQEQKEEFKQETKLRETIRQLLAEGLLQETDEDIPHSATGINVLEELLKKIIPVLEADFKTLTTSKEQRDSFRAHVINAIQNTLVTDRALLGAGKDEEKVAAPTDEESMEKKASRLKEKTEQVKGGTAPVAPQVKAPRIAEAVDMSLGQEPPPVDDVPADENAFIDIEDNPQEPEEVDNFTVPGMDMTGRNMALKSFEKIEKQIVDGYSLLGDEEDKEIFYDYLLTNIKLYTDKWEQELGQNVAEPTTSTYEKEKGQVADEKAAGIDTAKSELGI